jgi:hypothetical protein
MTDKLLVIRELPENKSESWGERLSYIRGLSIGWNNCLKILHKQAREINVEKLAEEIQTIFKKHYGYKEYYPTKQELELFRKFATAIIKEIG